ncbi:UNVERIFIED_ORG: hypothetical protein GGI57_006133 [Rhizobium aethiopicum]|uniref:hypothetical protein n=1 Tax=Rhizobium TaxID=379 RepID=UPI0013747251|nr:MULTISPECIES: hypothetical protein [Rhizobium]
MGKSRIGRVFSVAVAIGRRQSPAMPQWRKTWLTTGVLKAKKKMAAGITMTK